MVPQSEFVAKTHGELTRLSAEAKVARRARPNHPWCDDDKAPCRHCAAIRDIHACIDDHLLQLEADDTQATDLTSLAVAFHAPADETRVRAKHCSCGAQRYSDFNGYMFCCDCDFGPDAKWHSTGYDQLDTSDEADG